MFFTREDINKIHQALLKLGIKDSELPETSDVKNDDTLAIVQDGENKQINVREFLNQISLWKREDFINVTDKYKKSHITLVEAIQAIPIVQRKEGLVITFLDNENNWRIYQFRGSLLQFNNETLWVDLYDFSPYIIDSILPDEEDITQSAINEQGNTYLSLKNREYNPSEFSGKGYKILRRNIIEIEDANSNKVKKNILTSDMISEPNTIYEIRYDFDLNGAEITIPENCILNFVGGSFNNYNKITGVLLNKSLKPENFGAVGDGRTDDSKAINTTASLLCPNAELILNNNYKVSATNYYVSAVDSRVHRYAILINKSMTVKGGGKMLFTKVIDTQDAYCLCIIDTQDVYLHNLKILDANSYSSDEYDININKQKHGLFISNCSNLEIKNLYIKGFVGDGILIKNGTNFNITINNNKIIDCARNGITLGDGTNTVYITKNYIYNINKQNPKACIDIEPNYIDSLVSNVLISENTLYNGDNIAISLCGCNEIKIVNNLSDAICNISRICKNIDIHNNKFKSIITDGAKAQALVKAKIVNGELIISNESPLVFKKEATTQVTETNKILLVNKGTKLRLFSGTTIDLVYEVIDILSEKKLKVMAVSKGELPGMEEQEIIIASLFYTNYFITYHENNCNYKFTALCDYITIVGGIINKIEIVYTGNIPIKEFNIKQSKCTDSFELKLYSNLKINNIKFFDVNFNINIETSMLLLSSGISIQKCEFYNCKIRASGSGRFLEVNNSSIDIIIFDRCEIADVNCYITNINLKDNKNCSIIYSNNIFNDVKTRWINVIKSPKKYNFHKVFLINNIFNNSSQDNYVVQCECLAKNNIINGERSFRLEYGTLQNVPTPSNSDYSPMIGSEYYASDIKKIIVYDGEFWNYSNGLPISMRTSGTYSDKPNPKNIGFQYFNTDTHKMITWDGTKWWNPDGTEAVN